MPGMEQELIGKIHQFLGRQISDTKFDETDKDDIKFARDRLQRAYKIERPRSPSNELLEIYKTFKESNSDNIQASLFQGLANDLINQAVVGGLVDQNSNKEEGATIVDTTRKQGNETTKFDLLAAENFKNQGNDSMKHDRYSEAYDLYTKAISIDDNNAVYHSNRAAASTKLANYREALEDCRRAIEIDANYAVAYSRLGLAYSGLEDHLRAREAFDKAALLEQSHSDQRSCSIQGPKVTDSSRESQSGGSNKQEMAGMIRSMITNPDVVSMAVKSLQDPRVQDIVGDLLGTGIMSNNKRV